MGLADLSRSTSRGVLRLPSLRSTLTSGTAMREVARFAFTLEAPGALSESGKSSRAHSEYRCVCVCVCVCSEGGNRFYLRQNHPDRLCVPLNLPFVCYRVISRQQSSRGVNSAPHLQEIKIPVETNKNFLHLIKTLLHVSAYIRSHHQVEHKLVYKLHSC